MMTGGEGSGLANRPMSGGQRLAVFICLLLNALDGFDVLAITFAAPSFSREWGLPPYRTGLVISAGLAAMGLGSMCLAPLADRVGRRPMIFLYLGLMSIGMLLSSAATSDGQLIAWRIVTGAGIGGMLATVNALSSEHANRRWKSLAVAWMAIGFPLGGVLGGLAAAWLLDIAGWRAIFLAGGAFTAILLPVVAVALPESLDFLLSRQPRKALARANAVLRHFNAPTLNTLPPVERTHGRGAMRLSRSLIAGSFVIAIGYVFHMISFYYISGWLPSIITDLGFPKAEGSLVSVWMNIGGIFGGAAIGVVASMAGPYRPTAAVMLMTAVSLAVFGFVAPDLPILKLAAFLIGFFINAGVVGLYAVLADSFPAELRATGSGFVIGLGRVGATLGPIIAGTLMSAGFARSQINLVMAGAGGIAGSAIFLQGLRQARWRGQFRATQIDERC